MCRAVPAQLKLSDGRLLLKGARALFDDVIAEAKALDVPVHTVARLGRSVPEAVALNGPRKRQQPDPAGLAGSHGIGWSAVWAGD